MSDQDLSIAALRPMDRIWLKYRIDSASYGFRTASGVILSNNEQNQFFVISVDRWYLYEVNSLRGVYVTKTIAYDDVIEFKIRNS